MNDAQFPFLFGLRGRAAMQAEIPALRQQLTVLQRTQEAATGRAERDRPTPLGDRIRLGKRVISALSRHFRGKLALGFS
jgi:hypothetical protein